MATMNISLPDDMKAFVEDEAAKKGFGTVSEYVRAIIRDVQERQVERERLDAFLIEGLDSGPATPLTPNHASPITPRKRITFEVTVC
jgi:antitoxin ParD1/3/4